MVTIAKRSFCFHTLPKTFELPGRLAHVKGPWLAQFSDALVLEPYTDASPPRFYAVNKKYGHVSIDGKLRTVADAINLGNLARSDPIPLLTCDVNQVGRMSAPRSLM